MATRIETLLDGTGLAGHGGAILQYAQGYGVNPAFALAMFRKEAEFAKQGSIAYRQNNPGNIICGGGTTPLYGATGCGGRFGTYDTMADGIQAYFRLLDNEYRPGRKYDCEDIPCIIAVYCPPSNCDTARYVDQVTEWTIQYQNLLSAGGLLVLEPGPTVPSIVVMVVPATVFPESPAPQVGEGRIAFLSERDYEDVDTPSSYRPVELYVMNPDGSNQKRLTFGDTPLSLMGRGVTNAPVQVRQVFWVPGMQRIVAVLASVPDMALILRPSDGHLDHNLQFRSTIDGKTMLALFVAWSPFGERIAFIGNPLTGSTAGPQQAVWVANSDGSDWSQIVEQASDYGPAWSPEGDWIAFSRTAPIAERGLYVVRPDGTDMHLLAAGDYWDRRAWSPDGNQIASEIWDGHDIMLVDVGTGSTRKLTSTPETTEGHPAWSLDGTRIAFEVGWGTDAEVWVMNADGSNAQRLADGCCPAWMP